MSDQPSPAEWFCYDHWPGPDYLGQPSLRVGQIVAFRHTPDEPIGIISWIDKDPAIVEVDINEKYRGYRYMAHEVVPYQPRTGADN